MQMQGEQTIPAPREQVWAALNDPEVLRACIPGCESLEKDGDSFKASVTTKVGPVKAKFNGSVTLSDLDPPNGYTISGEGKGGAAGFARGSARVRLEEVPEGTLLHYDVDANVGGKLAQLGARLIDGTAKKLAGEFFDKFGEEVVKASPAEAPAAPKPAPAPEPEPVPKVAAEEKPEPPAAPPQEEIATAGETPEPPVSQPPPPRPPVGDESRPADAPMPPQQVKAPAGFSLPTWAWVAGLIVIVVVLLFVFSGSGAGIP